MIFMGYSIQEYLKKINSRLSFYDSLSILLTAISAVLLSVYISTTAHADTAEITYSQNNSSVVVDTSNFRSNSPFPFASRKGKTYTFSWCSGSGRISPKNKITFHSESEAQATGRTLSKLCKK
jgi:hypothetical protein